MPMKRWLWWASWIPSGLGIFIILSSARWKLTRSPFYVAEWGRIGYADSTLFPIALVQVACLILYLIPQTSVLGVVLFTGYLGGAIASYVRMREPRPPLVPLTTALLLWLGLYLREERLWALLPFRRKAAR
jgi:DoxX-like family